MTNVKIRVLMGASALALSVGAAVNANAQVTQVYGGGSTLSAPYVRQAEDCFGLQTPLYTPGKAATNPPTESYDGTNCATTQADPAVQFNLEASGSGAGVLAFFQHNPAQLGSYTNTAGTAGQFFPAEHYGTSDTAMGEASVAIYNGGGTTEPATGKTVNVVAANTTPGAGYYPNPQATYGSMVQVPLLITPITIAYSPVYKKVLQADGVTVKTYSFNISLTANKGVLRLDLPTYCKIFNGQITDWNDPAIAALNGKVVNVVTGSGKTKVTTPTVTPLNDPADPDVLAGKPFSQKIELVGRSDSSGTTSIFTRALAAQCSGLTGVTNQYANANSTLPSALVQGTTGLPGSGRYTVASGSGGVAGYMKFYALASGVDTGPQPTVQGTAGELTSGKIAYLSPDYVGPVNTTYGLVYAALGNYNTELAALAPSSTTKVTYVLPTAKAALASFGSITAPSLPGTVSTVSATNSAIVTAGAIGDPAAWVQAPDKGAAIATPTSATGYPIVGTTQLLAYTCYADTTKNSSQNIGYKMNRFLYFYLKNPIVTASNGILYTYGFAPLPAAFRTAEYNAFVLPGAANPYYISPKSDLIETTGTKTKVIFAHNTACDAAGVTGG
jgi:ABC-type phosphate transport system substrate-binding protein